MLSCVTRPVTICRISISLVSCRPLKPSGTRSIQPRPTQNPTSLDMAISGKAVFTIPKASTHKTVAPAPSPATTSQSRTPRRPYRTSCHPAVGPCHVCLIPFPCLSHYCQPLNHCVCWESAAAPALHSSHWESHSLQAVWHWFPPDYQVSPSPAASAVSLIGCRPCFCKRDQQDVSGDAVRWDKMVG